MNIEVNELATSNLVVIWVIILTGFAFLKVMKKSMRDQITNSGIPYREKRDQSDRRGR